jgi:hypothetical protein
MTRVAFCDDRLRLHSLAQAASKVWPEADQQELSDEFWRNAATACVARTRFKAVTGPERSLLVFEPISIWLAAERLGASVNWIALEIVTDTPETLVKASVEQQLLSIAVTLPKSTHLPALLAKVVRQLPADLGTGLIGTRRRSDRGLARAMGHARQLLRQRDRHPRPVVPTVRIEPQQLARLRAQKAITRQTTTPPDWH